MLLRLYWSLDILTDLKRAQSAPRLTEMTQVDCLWCWCGISVGIRRIHLLTQCVFEPEELHLSSVGCQGPADIAGTETASASSFSLCSHFFLLFRQYLTSAFLFSLYIQAQSSCQLLHLASCHFPVLSSCVSCISCLSLSGINKQAPPLCFASSELHLVNWSVCLPFYFFTWINHLSKLSNKKCCCNYCRLKSPSLIFNF